MAAIMASASSLVSKGVPASASLAADMAKPGALRMAVSNRARDFAADVALTPAADRIGAASSLSAASSQVCRAVSRASEVIDHPDVAAIDVEALREELEGASPLAIMDKALALYGEDIAIAFSGAEDVALVELASLTGRPFRVFCLDTGRLNPETHRFLQKVREHYGVKVEVMFPDPAAVQELVQTKGLFSFYEDGHKECCSIRKVEPLKRALRGLKAWVTGQRRDQSLDTRGGIQVVENDPAFAGLEGPGTLVKFNPLAKVTGAAVWSLLDAQGVPVNELHERGYVSIGCEPCTRPVLPHQHEREGRWWWESAAAKECGLHKGGDPAAATSAGSATSAAPVSTAAAPQVPSDALGSPAVEAGAPAQGLSREEQDWPDLYVSNHVASLTRQQLEAILNGGAQAEAPSGAPGNGAAAAAGPPSSYLLVVYAPWCPFCKALEPAWLKTAEALAGSVTSHTSVVKFRGDRQERAFVSERLGVKSFPSIFMIRPNGPGQPAGVVKRQSERRDVGSLLHWVETLQ